METVKKGFGVILWLGAVYFASAHMSQTTMAIATCFVLVSRQSGMLRHWRNARTNAKGRLGYGRDSSPKLLDASGKQANFTNVLHIYSQEILIH